MDFGELINIKKYFRFTGPPEHWLTAIKYMTWGLEEKYKERWQEIQPGDIFFIHSTGSNSSLFKNAKSGILGLGIVAANFSIKNDFLWLREHLDKKNYWPLLIPFSEIYIFSELSSLDSWDASKVDEKSKTEKLISELLKQAIPISSISGFPQMGSFSKVSTDVAKQILFDNKPLHLYSADSESSVFESKRTELTKVSNAVEALRYEGTLLPFDNISTRTVAGESHFTRDNELLARAEKSHSSIINRLIGIFQSRGYETLSNRNVDLYAHNKEKSFLFEVKSTENNNFRPQARKGVVQLLEYEYFEISKYISDKNYNFKEKYDLLIPSKIPKDDKYINFINDLDIGVALADGNSLKPIGNDFGFSKI
ncbi:MAG: hypothetical protein A2231_08740 [Candidatus Firestonebacteria bacterium RIFOXYA2_FULL_40_8]|nr:MAG: hypothetical protein A2231_08740 [Candidatus Firestonebacteria bacterium RIFOXYA2_FULL_40_8]